MVLVWIYFCGVLIINASGWYCWGEGRIRGTSWEMLSLGRGWSYNLLEIKKQHQEFGCLNEPGNKIIIFRIEWVQWGWMD